MPHGCHRFWKCHKPFTFCPLLTRCTIPCACHAKRQKWHEHVVFLTFWLRNVLRASSRHNGVHFFDISTSKSGPNMVCFVHFDFEMCFAPQRRGPDLVCFCMFLHFDLEMCFVPQRRALFRHLNFQKWSEREVFCDVLWHFDLEMCFVPQRRALFRHRNFQKWSGPGVFCAFWLGNVLRATTACTFSSLIWPDGSAPAALASLLFDPPEPQIMGKTPGFATFLPFRAPASSFFWDFLFSDLLSSSLLFSSLLYSSAPHLLSSVHIVGSLTSKLPSAISVVPGGGGNYKVHEQIPAPPPPLVYILRGGGSRNTSRPNWRSWLKECVPQLWATTNCPQFYYRSRAFRMIQRYPKRITRIYLKHS